MTAIDGAGNATYQSFPYAVSYNVCPLFDQDKAVKSGATIPIKLQLCDAAQPNHSSGSISVVATGVRFVSGTATGELQDAGNANPDFNFRYEPSLAGYIFNMKTTGLASGTWELLFTAGSDGAPHAVRFQVR